jgi:F-type H+-transporting ATPase subunit gamma
MATREVLRRRVQSTETLRSVVQTMKALATVRIGQVRRAVKALDASAATLELAFQALLQREPELAAFLLPSGSDAWAAVLFGSDHGLCGPFNERVGAPRAHAALSARRGARPAAVMVAGRRLRSRIAALGYGVERVLTLPGSVDATEAAVLQVVDQIETWQRDHGVARVFVVHHRPTTGVAYRPHTLQLLPLDLEWLRELRDRPWPTNRLPMLGLEGEELLRGLVRQQLAMLLVRAFAASQAAENAARLAAMEAAERNVDERLTQLRTPPTWSARTPSPRSCSTCRRHTRRRGRRPRAFGAAPPPPAAAPWPRRPRVHGVRIGRPGGAGKNVGELPSVSASSAMAVAMTASDAMLNEPGSAIRTTKDPAVTSIRTQRSPAWSNARPFCLENPVSVAAGMGEPLASSCSGR